MLDQNIFGTCLSFFLAIFAITNPLSGLTIFISLTSGLYPKERNQVAILATISIFIIIIVSMLLGSYILQFFGISNSAFRLAGGLVIANAAFPMLKGAMSNQKQNEEERKELQETKANESNFQPSSIAVVPLALPLIAGPGAISTAVLWAERLENIWVLIALVITTFIYSVIVYFMFYVSPYITRFLGQTGINVITRVMGLFMLAIGVQAIISSCIDLMPSLFIK
ncbi:NAAT family transporter [Psittacicella gerlachiana]|uniref:UPF0056 membrane protein n=1 Tax=Psittacicella gerlachiana TaxID=2028574 RepID=A0A3A1YK52_9GAMM|nr:NAAT family transporter [Psittacicella gerlachiana]RIY37836.1 hypothetical protein CKF59_01395 [Psittacicella gerlachiana]